MNTSIAPGGTDWERPDKPMDEAGYNLTPGRARRGRAGFLQGERKPGRSVPGDTLPGLLAFPS